MESEEPEPIPPFKTFGYDLNIQNPIFLGDYSAKQFPEILSEPIEYNGEPAYAKATKTFDVARGFPFSIKPILDESSGITASFCNSEDCPGYSYNTPNSDGSMTLIAEGDLMKIKLLGKSDFRLNWIQFDQLSSVDENGVPSYTLKKFQARPEFLMLGDPSHEYGGMFLKPINDDVGFDNGIALTYNGEDPEQNPLERPWSNQKYTAKVIFSFNKPVDVTTLEPKDDRGYLDVNKGIWIEETRDQVVNPDKRLDGEYIHRLLGQPKEPSHFWLKLQDPNDPNSVFGINCNARMLDDYTVEFLLMNNDTWDGEPYWVTNLEKLQFHIHRSILSDEGIDSENLSNYDENSIPYYTVPPGITIILDTLLVNDADKKIFSSRYDLDALAYSTVFTHHKKIESVAYDWNLTSKVEMDGRYKFWSNATRYPTSGVKSIEKDSYYNWISDGIQGKILYKTPQLFSESVIGLFFCLMDKDHGNDFSLSEDNLAKAVRSAMSDMDDNKSSDGMVAFHNKLNKYMGDGNNSIVGNDKVYIILSQKKYTLFLKPTLDCYSSHFNEATTFDGGIYGGIWGTQYHSHSEGDSKYLVNFLWPSIVAHDNILGSVCPTLRFQAKFEIRLSTFDD